MNEKNKYDEDARKQIEKMAWELCDIPMHPNIHSCEECGGKNCHAQYYAERAYNADYRKQSEGEWILEEAWDVRSVDSYRCSMCGDSKRVDEAESFVYCPNCGAKMKGGAE